ncbi:TetR/AcrR family transcriptional regulator [Kitasatospora sp. NBC_00070]|uniref:TetR/AcrR family transcriptional regulator n=1 Tax=Kitasatospora sp. NBC_00070 TaxID=2975962 RepID=UPI0038600E9C
MHSALAAMARGGVGAVRVEPIAAELGATKGSFYWYFANREALVTAALQHWLRETTEGVAETLAELPDPTDRLRALLGTVFAERPGRGLEVALQADVDSPEVRSVLAEADRRRLAILRGLLTDVGLAGEAAERTALSGYATYLGFLQLQRTDPDLVPNGADRAAYVDSLLATMLAGH